MNTLPEARQLQNRTKIFAIRIIKAFARLPKNEAGRVIGRQFLRSGTSLAANYRAACRARSAADFISKVSVVAEEADETLFWLELLIESQLVRAKLVAPIDVGIQRVVTNFCSLVATAKRGRAVINR